MHQASAWAEAASSTRTAQPRTLSSSSSICDDPGVAGRTGRADAARAAAAQPPRRLSEIGGVGALAGMGANRGRAGGSGSRPPSRPAGRARRRSGPRAARRRRPRRPPPAATTSAARTSNPLANALRRPSTIRAAGASRSRLQSSKRSRLRWRSGRVGSRERTTLGERRTWRRISAVGNVAVRAAASSIASGRPSSSAQSAATTSRSAPSPAAALRNSSDAPSVGRGRTGRSRSPRRPSGPATGGEDAHSRAGTRSVPRPRGRPPRRGARSCRARAARGAARGGTSTFGHRSAPGRPGPRPRSRPPPRSRPRHRAGRGRRTTLRPPSRPRR